MTKTYAEKLRDPRWQKKRLQVLQDAGFACSECGSVERTLHIHHPFYRKGVEPWDYADWDLICVCEDCHEDRASCERALLLSVKTWKRDSIDSLSMAIFDALAIGYSPRAIAEAVVRRLEVAPTEKEIL